MNDFWMFAIIGVAVGALMYVIYRVTYARSYEQGYRHATEDNSIDSGNLKGVGGMCGKCGWEAPQVGSFSDIFKSIITHECDEN